MAKKFNDVNDDFNFEDFYTEDTEVLTTVQEEDEEPEGVFCDEEEYDKLLDLHNDEHSIGVDAKYPYIKVSGFLISDEVRFMIDRLQSFKEEINDKYDEEEMINVSLVVNDDDYIIDKFPLTLDTIMTIISPRSYDVVLVRDEDKEIPINGEMMKALLFT